nr:hypothetical protein [Tanacetum cinerariifolium]
MDKKKKFDLNLEIFRYIFQIFPRVHDASSLENFWHYHQHKSIWKDNCLDKLRLARAQILWGMYYKKNADYVELLWEDFTYQIDNRGHKKQDKMYYPRFTKVIIYHFLTKDKTIYKRNKIGMHNSRDKYLINTLRFVSAKEESQIYRHRLPKSITSPEMRETKAYKTYLGYATCVVIRETPVKSLSKKKEKMIVEKRKGIDLLSEVALTKKSQYEEVCKKILRDFHKTHPSGSGTVTKISPSAAKIKPSVTNEGTGVKPGNKIKKRLKMMKKKMWTSLLKPHPMILMMKMKQRLKIGNEDEGMDYTTNQLDDDVDLRMNEPVTTDEGFIQKEGTDAEMTNVEQGYENSKITLNQVTEDAHVTLSTVPQKTGVPVTNSSHSSDLASKFLNFSDIPHTDAEMVSPADVHVYYEGDPLNTQVTALVDEHLDSRLGATRDEFMSYLSASIIARIKKQVKSELPQILPKEVSNFAPAVIKSMVTESLEHAVLTKESS